MVFGCCVAAGYANSVSVAACGGGAGNNSQSSGTPRRRIFKPNKGGFCEKNGKPLENDTQGLNVFLICAGLAGPGEKSVGPQTGPPGPGFNIWAFSPAGFD